MVSLNSDRTECIAASNHRWGQFSAMCTENIRKYFGSIFLKLRLKYHPLQLLSFDVLPPPHTSFCRSLLLYLLSSPSLLPWPGHLSAPDPVPRYSLSHPALQLTLRFGPISFVFIWLWNFLRCLAALRYSSLDFSLQLLLFPWAATYVIIMISIITFIPLLIHGIYETCLCDSN
jgi:hypothetical protein